MSLFSKQANHLTDACAGIVTDRSSQEEAADTHLSGTSATKVRNQILQSSSSVLTKFRVELRDEAEQEAVRKTVVRDLLYLSSDRIRLRKAGNDNMRVFASSLVFFGHSVPRPGPPPSHLESRDSIDVAFLVTVQSLKKL